MYSGSLALSADDLRRMTKWPDALIEDYLSLTRSVGDITTNINIVVQEIAAEAGSSAQNFALIAELQKSLVTIGEQVSALDAIPSQIANNKRDILRQVVALQEQAADFSPLIAKVASLRRDLTGLIDGLAQQSQATLLLVREAQTRLGETQDQLNDLSQQVAGMA